MNGVRIHGRVHMSRVGQPLAIVVVLVAATLLAGCLAATPEPPCDARTLMTDGVAFLADTAGREPGIPARPGSDPDPRTTAWVLLATGLARRAGLEGAFDSSPHVAWLVDHVDDMMREGTPVDSSANNVSLVRVALQVWGKPAEGIPANDPAHPEARSLADVWDAHYDVDSGRYGVRANEHLFAGFAAWLFGAHDTVRVGMADHTESMAANGSMWGDAGPFAHDAWWAAYARLAVGPDPVNASLDAHLADVLGAHRMDGGGVRGFAGAATPDGSTTAAALMAWRVDGVPRSNPLTLGAIGYLCAAQRADGAVPFSDQVEAPLVKTTAEVVMAAAMVEQPVPWGDPRGSV